jgi:hypothetical protein
MSDRALALIFLNLGGEMLYVLDQRLYAQKIQVEKGNRSKIIFSPQKALLLRLRFIKHNI